MAGIDATSSRGKTVEVICKECGMGFSTYPSTIKRGSGKFCSSKCFYKNNIGNFGHNKGVKLSEETKLKMSLSRRKEKHWKWDGGGIERNCKKCGKSFLSNRSQIEKGNGKYCSRECFFSLFPKRVEKVCQNCGIKFFIKPSMNKRGGGAGRFCSLKCKGIWYSNNLKGKNSRGWKGGITSLKQKVRTSLEYNQWRQKVFIRDNFTCCECRQKGGKIEAHHKKSFAILIQEAKDCLPLFDLYTACLLYSPMWDISNGITLCKNCHGKTKNYGLKGRKNAR